MAILVSRLSIERFRGIHDLLLENLNHINIIAGDNNSGKTSVLEAMLLLRNPKDFNNILRIARMRDLNTPASTATVYESFINLFPRSASPSEILLDGVCLNGSVVIRLLGEQKSIMIAPEDLYQYLPQPLRKNRIKDFSAGTETAAFMGELEVVINEAHERSAIEYHAHSRVTGREIDKNNYLDIVYLSPTDHVRGNVFDSIVRDDIYKEICLNVLRLFDKEILDILYQRNEETNRPVEYVRHAALGNMPLSTYGDGIKKVLSLANGIARAANGVLLIDELETAIHSKYYDDIFRFIVKACKQFQVQAFITTHSIEAIDGMLATQDYGTNDMDDLSVITVSKEPGSKRTYSRVLSGRRVYTNREEFGFEVRL